MNETKSL